ncbi:Conserved_hypothetical protein [Hexamita inflata]|uniref:Uncharacterized protein n=1 Tax=Hexamita inflata TaxID=28002 RepID=A0AA86U7T1_9EUKA|nr:Conserved hypothetical protein [Hexamita inflata]
MQLNETNSEPVPDKIISPIPLQDILLSAHQDISQHLGAFLATGDQPQLNQSVKTCYKAMSLVDVLHDYCPSIVSLGATLVTPSTWKLLSASNLKVRLEIFRRVLCDPLYTKPIDTALFDPEYQVSDAISIASLNYTFPFVQFSSNSASLSQFFNKDYYGKQTEEFMFELAQTCNKQLKQKQKLYIQGNILYIENPGFVLQLFFYQNRDFKDAYTDINTLQFYFLQLNQKKSLNGYNSLELQNYVNLIGKKNISNNCILSICLYYDYLQTDQQFKEYTLNRKDSQNYFVFQNTGHNSNRWRQECKDFKSPEYLDTAPVIAIVFKTPGQLDGFHKTNTIRELYSQKFYDELKMYKYSTIRDLEQKTFILSNLTQHDLYIVSFYRLNYNYPYGFKQFQTGENIQFDQFENYLFDLNCKLLQQTNRDKIEQIPGTLIQNKIEIQLNNNCRYVYTLGLGTTQIFNNKLDVTEQFVQLNASPLTPEVDNLNRLSDLFVLKQQFKLARFSKNPGFEVYIQQAIKLVFHPNKCSIVLQVLSTRFEFDLNQNLISLKQIEQQLNDQNAIQKINELLLLNNYIINNNIYQFGNQIVYEGNSVLTLVNKIFKNRPHSIVQKTVKREFKKSEFTVQQNQIGQYQYLNISNGEQVFTGNIGIQFEQNVVELVIQVLQQLNKFKLESYSMQNKLIFKISSFKYSIGLSFQLPVNFAPTLFQINNCKKFVALTEENSKMELSPQKKVILSSFTSANEVLLGQRIINIEQQLKLKQNSNINTYLNDLKVLIEAQNFINKTQQRRETVGIKLERSLEDLQENEHRKREIEKREIRRIRIGDTVLELGRELMIKKVQ